MRSKYLREFGERLLKDIKYKTELHYLSFSIDETTDKLSRHPVITNARINYPFENISLNLQFIEICNNITIMNCFYDIKFDEMFMDVIVTVQDI